mgnify:FL=1
MRPASLHVFALALITTVGCGAPETPEPEPSSPRVETEDPTETETQPPGPTPTEEPPPEVATPESPPPAPPAPEPVAVEAGTSLGPIRIGMSEDDVRALGLPVGARDSRSARFGPYRVWLDDEGVRRVEAHLGALERVRLGGQVFDVDAHIHAMRDAIGSCVWTEGGGERYRCADGTLFVFTDHSLDPARYVIAVERR